MPNRNTAQNAIFSALLLFLVQFPIALAENSDAQTQVKPTTPGPRAKSAFEIWSLMEESRLTGEVMPITVDGRNVTFGAEKEASSSLITRVAGPKQSVFATWANNLPDADEDLFYKEFLSGWMSGRLREKEVRDKDGVLQELSTEGLTGIDFNQLSHDALYAHFQTWLQRAGDRSFSFISSAYRRKIFNGEIGGKSVDGIGKSAAYYEWLPHYGLPQKYITNMHNLATIRGWEINFEPQATYAEYDAGVKWFRETLAVNGNLFEAPGHQRIVFPNHPEGKQTKSKRDEVLRGIQTLIILKSLEGKSGIQFAKFKDIYTDDRIRTFGGDRNVIRIEGNRFGTDTFAVEQRAGTKFDPTRRNIQQIMVSRFASNDFDGIHDIGDYKLFSGSPTLSAETLAKRFYVTPEVAEKAITNIQASKTNIRDADRLVKMDFILPFWEWETVPFLSQPQKAQIRRITHEFIEQMARTKTPSRSQLEQTLADWAEASRLSESFETYLRPKEILSPEQLGERMTHENRGPPMVDANNIGLGIEYTGRFPIGDRSEIAETREGKSIWLRPVHSFTVKDRSHLVRQIALSLASKLGGKVKASESVAATNPNAAVERNHGHGIGEMIVVIDSQGREWHVEWDGISRNYNEQSQLIAESPRGGVVEITTPKLVPTPHEVQTVFDVYQEHGLIPDEKAGGGHLNFDLKAFEGRPEAMARFIRLFLKHRGIISLMYQHPGRLKSAEPNFVSPALDKALANFSGSEEQLKRLLYDHEFFNPRLGRKTHYNQLNLIAYFQDVIPEEFLTADYDIKNEPWHHQFKAEPTIRKGEFRLFNAPRNAAEATSQIRLLRALMNEAINSAAPIGIGTQEVSHEAYVKNPNQAYQDLGKLTEQLNLPLEVFWPAVTHGIAESKNYVESEFYQPYAVKIADAPKQDGWKRSVPARSPADAINSEERLWTGIPTANARARLLQTRREQAVGEQLRRNLPEREKLPAPSIAQIIEQLKSKEHAQIQAAQLFFRAMEEEDIKLILKDLVSKTTPESHADLATVYQRLHSPEVVEILKRLIKDRDPMVRRGAVFALAASGAEGSLEIAREILANSKDANLRIGTAQGLANREESSKETEALLIQVMNDEEALVRRSLMDYLARSPETPNNLELARLGLNDEADRVRESAVRALGVWDSDTSHSAVVKAFNDPSPLVESAVCAALLNSPRTLSPEDAKLILSKDPSQSHTPLSLWGHIWQEYRPDPQVATKLDQDSVFRSLQKKAVMDLATNPSDATLPAIRAALTNTDKDIRELALTKALQDRHSEETVRLLRELLTDMNYSTRVLAAKRLAKEKTLKTVPSQAESIVSQLANHDQRALRLEGAQALTHYRGENSFTKLRQLLKDPDIGVQRKAAEVLALRSQEPEALPIMLEALKETDRLNKDVHSTLVRALSKTPRVENYLTPKLQALLFQYAGSSDISIWLPAISTLEKLPNPIQHEWIQKGFADPSTAPNSAAMRLMETHINSVDRSEFIPEALKAINHSNGSLVQHALSYLFEHSHSLYLENLERVLARLDDDVRAKCLFDFGLHAVWDNLNVTEKDTALKIAERAFAIPNSKIRESAIHAIKNGISHENAIPTLLRLMKNDSPFVRKAAAQIFTESDHVRSEHAKLFFDLGLSGDIGVKKVMVDGLQHAPKEVLQKHLPQLLKKPIPEQHLDGISLGLQALDPKNPLTWDLLAQALSHENQFIARRAIATLMFNAQSAETLPPNVLQAVTSLWKANDKSTHATLLAAFKSKSLMRIRRQILEAAGNSKDPKIISSVSNELLTNWDSYFEKSLADIYLVHIKESLKVPNSPLRLAALAGLAHMKTWLRLDPTQQAKAIALAETAYSIPDAAIRKLADSIMEKAIRHEALAPALKRLIHSESPFVRQSVAQFISDMPISSDPDDHRTEGLFDAGFKTKDGAVAVILTKALVHAPLKVRTKYLFQLLENRIPESLNEGMIENLDTFPSDAAEIWPLLEKALTNPNSAIVIAALRNIDQQARETKTFPPSVLNALAPFWLHKDPHIKAAFMVSLVSRKMNPLLKSLYERALQSPNIDVVREASIRLAGSGDAVPSEFYTQMVKSNDPIVFSNAMKIVLREADKESELATRANQLEEALKNTNPTNRLLLAETATKLLMGLPENLHLYSAPIGAALLNEVEPLLRQAGAKILSRNNGPEVMQAIEKGLKSEVGATRRAAMAALAPHNDAASIAALKQALHSKDYSVRTWAEATLERRSDSAAQQLKEYLKPCSILLGLIRSSN